MNITNKYFLIDKYFYNELICLVTSNLCIVFSTWSLTCSQNSSSCPNFNIASVLGGTSGICFSVLCRKTSENIMSLIFFDLLLKLKFKYKHVREN